MKKLFLNILLLTTFLGLSQEKRSTDLSNRKYEVKFGALKLLAGTIFEGTYEYIYSEDFTFGSSLLVNFDKTTDYNEDFSITPFARFYFQETKEYGAKGFFVEGFGKYASGRDYQIFSDGEKYNAAALGISLGKKWVNNSGFVLEVLFGGARTLGGSDKTPDAFFRGDLFLGYRF